MITAQYMHIWIFRGETYYFVQLIYAHNHNNRKKNCVGLMKKGKKTELARDFQV
jgi:hypothetical protein